MAVTLRSCEQYDLTVTTTEMHTGGDPVRIIESGYPVPQGKTLLEKVEYLRKNCDDFRKFVMWEPRGHFDMYGVLLVAPDDPKADIATIFMHNEGYSTMCGHVTISLGRYVIDRGLIKRPITSPETEVFIQTPCGTVTAIVQVQIDRGVVTTGRVTFESVPSFVVQTDLTVPVDGLGEVQVDIVYGGAFYAFVTASDIGLVLGLSPAWDVRRVATAIKNAAIPLVKLNHPSTPAFLYGVIVVDDRRKKCTPASTSICIYADASACRSPCGSGTTAFVALMYHRGLLAIGESHVFKSGTTGSEFTAWPVKDTCVGDKKAINVMVQGEGHYSGRSTMLLEKGDTFGHGFLVH